MGRRKYGKEAIRSLQRSYRGSYLVSIPVSLIRSLGWQERQKVVVKKYGKGKLIIKDWTK